MIKPKVFVFLVALALLVPCLSWGAPVLEFTTAQGGSIYYGERDGAGFITGLAIPVVSVIGLDTPLNAGVALSLVGQGDLLSFQTGIASKMVDNSGFTVFVAQKGGYVTITQTVLGGNLASGNLSNSVQYGVTGNFTGDFSNFSLSSVLQQFYGVGNSWLGQMTIGTRIPANITSTSFIPFNGSVMLTAVPIPPSFLIMASGLLGLGIVRKRIA